MTNSMTGSVTHSGLNKKSRIVIKIGSSLLVDAKSGLRQEWLNSLTDDINELKKNQSEILLVSSGAIAMGRNLLGMPNRTLKLDENQAAAAVGQIELAKAWSQSLGRHNLVAAQVLLTLPDTEGHAGRRRYLNARDTISRLLKLESVPVVNENDTVATSEIRYGDNDRLAARVATMMNADLLILLSDVDGLYDAPPETKKGAKFIETVEQITPEIEKMAGEAGSGLSRGGMVTKIEAAKIVTQAGAEMIITSGKKNNPVSSLKKGARATQFWGVKAPGKKSETARKKWIAGQLENAGSVVVDEGASKALANNKSLLPAGVVRIEGKFGRGDVVTVVGEDGVALARGLIAYDSEDAKQIAGKQSSEMADVLGYEGRATMIHRDDMVLLTQKKDVK